MKTSGIIEQLNERTSNAFSYLRLSFGEAELSKRQITLAFLYPEARERDVLDNEDRLVALIREIAAVPCALQIRFIKSHFDNDFFKTRLFKFLFAYPALAGGLTEQDVVIRRDAEHITVTLHIEEALVAYCTDKKVIKAIEDFIALNYCEPIVVTVQPKADTKALDSIDEYERQLEYEQNGVSLDRADEQRLIRPQMVEDFIGDIIYDMAKYICDCKRPEQRLVICGTIEGFREVERKNVPEGKPNKFFKFVLRDPTGEMSCLYFPNRRTVEQMSLLKDGKQIVCCGDLDLDKFRPGQMTYSIRRISLCMLPADFKINRIVRKVDEKYRYVFPEPYRVVAQDSLFRVEDKPPAFAVGKTFCVFDIETTGLNASQDKIIEIGAVRVVNGRISETFSTFVNPGIPIPERITELTTITDEDVKGAPTIDEALPDFYKFSYNTVIVGQNVQFDCGFISVAGQEMNIYFDNERMDTLALGRRYLPTLGKYKLSNLTEYFGITNKGAHRAIYDAIATAEVFLKLAEFIR